MLQTVNFFKLLLIGDSGVGKTSLAIRFSDPDEWVDTHLPTIGVDFKIKNIMLDGRNVKLQIWDTAGQERFRSLSETYYRGSHGVILVYDVTSKDSFESVRKWAEEVNKYTPQDVIKMIVANKTDLQRVVTTDEGTKLAEDLGTLYIETSVKDKVNVDETFANLTREILKSNSGKPRQEQGVSNAQLNESARPSSNGSSNQTKKRRCMI